MDESKDPDIDYKKLAEELVKRTGKSVNITVISQAPPCPSNMLAITNDWGDVIGYAPKPADYWEEPGY